MAKLREEPMLAMGKGKGMEFDWVGSDGEEM